jgi:uridine kinase
VLLGGPSRSGKTLVANALRLALGRRGILSLHLGLDRFLVAHEERDPKLGFEGRIGFDAAKRAALALAEGQGVLVPGYDARTRSRAPGLVMQRPTKAILIVDGLLATELPLDGALRIELMDDEPRLQMRRTSFYAWKGLPEPTDAPEEQARIARATDGAHVRLRVTDDYAVKEIT